jgi:hypothetical protein
MGEKRPNSFSNERFEKVISEIEIKDDNQKEQKKEN